MRALLALPLVALVAGASPRPIPPRAVDPHRSTKNVYVSRLGFVSLIAIMRKTRARAHNGWQRIEWTRSSGSARFSELARGQVCTSCHFQARKTDYVFTKRR